MKLLLDTHLLILAAVDPGRLPAPSAELIADPANDLLFSAASIWECSIKYGLYRPDFTVNPALLRQGLLAAGYSELAVSSLHALATANLPPIHRDPFDRMLIAQAITEPATLVTADPLVASYPGPIRSFAKPASRRRRSAPS